MCQVLLGAVRVSGKFQTVRGVPGLLDVRGCQGAREGSRSSGVVCQDEWINQGQSRCKGVRDIMES